MFYSQEGCLGARLPFDHSTFVSRACPAAAASLGPHRRVCGAQRLCHRHGVPCGHSCRPCHDIGRPSAAVAWLGRAPLWLGRAARVRLPRRRQAPPRLHLHGGHRGCVASSSIFAALLASNCRDSPFRLGCPPCVAAVGTEPPVRHPRGRDAGPRCAPTPRGGGGRQCSV